MKARWKSKSNPGTLISERTFNTSASDNTGKPSNISTRLRLCGGFTLRSWLLRKGIVMDHCLTEKQTDELREVYELCVQDQGSTAQDGISNKSIGKALDLLRCVRRHPLTTLKETMNFAEFSSFAVENGFGQHDVLSELYDAKTTKIVQSWKERITGLSQAPDLLLLQTRRERRFKGLYTKYWRQRQDGDEKDKDSGIRAQHVGATEHAPGIATRRNSVFIRTQRKRKSVRPARDSVLASSVSAQMVQFALLILRARGISVGVKNRADPWILIVYGNLHYRTQVLKNTTEPQWNQDFQFNVNDKDRDIDVQLTCLSGEFSHSNNKDNVLGSVALSYNQLSSGFSGWLTLENPKSIISPQERTQNAEIFVVVKPKFSVQTLSGSMKELQCKKDANNVDGREAANIAALELMMNWDQKKGNSSLYHGNDPVSIRYRSHLRLYIPPSIPLASLRLRSLPVSLSAKEVLDNLRTPFAAKFSADTLEPVSKATESFLSVSAPDLASTDYHRFSYGLGHCLALSKSGKLFAWGSLVDSKRSSADMANTVTCQPRDLIKNTNASIQDLSGHNVEMDANGRGQHHNSSTSPSDSTEEQSNRPQLVPALQDVVVFDVSCGDSHCAALTKDGLVFCWGTGVFGKLGHGGLFDEPEPRLVNHIAKRRTIQIACGANHTMALTDNGSLWSWGEGKYGQLGHGVARDCGIPARIRKLEEECRVREISCGRDFGAAVMVDGKVFTWGLGWYGQLGHKRVQSSLSIAKQRKQLSLSLHSKSQQMSYEPDFAHLDIIDRLDIAEASISCNLGHKLSECTDDKRTRCSYLPGRVENLEGYFVKKIACGSQHMIALVSSEDSEHNVVWTWGDSMHGQLGHVSWQHDLRPKQVTAFNPANVIDIAAGETWSAVFFEDDSEPVVMGKFDLSLSTPFQNLQRSSDLLLRPSSANI